MTVYVDKVQFYPQSSLKQKRWCHMGTDGPIEELHAVAERIGLRRAWFQDKPGHPHYDLFPSKRRLALSMGLVTPVNGLELIKRCYPALAEAGQRFAGKLDQKTQKEEALLPLPFE